MIFVSDTAAQYNAWKIVTAETPAITISAVQPVGTGVCEHVDEESKKAPALPPEKN